MPSTREIRRRIRTIRSTAQITKAMEMVAASKMRRAQLRVIAARPYAEKMRDVLAHLASQPRREGEVHPLLEQRPVQHIGVLHITADRGLCGGLNANMNRRAAAFILEHRDTPVRLVSVGRRGRDFMVRYGQDIQAEFTQIGDQPRLADTLAVSRVLMDDYQNGVVDQVFLAYSEFVTTLVQRPVIRMLLPIEPMRMERGRFVEYIYEPSSPLVLEGLLPRFVEMQVYHAILESIASEQSARMVAMHNATDNALDMVEELTLEYNKARQASITKEITEIAAGAVALE